MHQGRWRNARTEALRASMEKVKIPVKVLLDAMMKELGLPNAVYSTQKGRLVGLDGTKQQLDNGLPQRTIFIHVYNKLEEAEDQLATEALRYMEGSYGMVLQDLNYEKLQLAQQKCKSLEHHQKEKSGIINYLTNSWCNSLNGDRMAAKELYRIIDSNFTAGSTSDDNNLNHVLSQVRYVADHLSDTTTQPEYDLQQTNHTYWSRDDDIEGSSALSNAGHEEQQL